jgi:hypothetical protein
LNGEIFYSVTEAEVLIESWRKHYKALRPHSSYGYRLSGPETIAAKPPCAPLWPARQRTESVLELT